MILELTLDRQFGGRIGRPDHLRHISVVPPTSCWRAAGHAAVISALLAVLRLGTLACGEPTSSPRQQGLRAGRGRFLPRHAKWQLAGHEDVWDSAYMLMIGGLVVAEVLQIAGRLIRRRQGEAHEEINSVEPGGGPPGWRWNATRSTWTWPDT